MTTIHKAALADMTPDEQALFAGEGEAATQAGTAAEAAAAAAEGAGTTAEAGGTDEATGTADDQQAGAAENAADAADAATTAAAAETTQADAAAALAEIEAPAQQPPKTYLVAQDDFAAQRKALQDERKALITKWGGGELSDDEYATQLDALDGKIFDVLQAHSKAQTLADINAQHQREAQERTQAAERAAMGKVATASKAAGQIDYASDEAACTLFDATFSAVKADPANAKLTPDELVGKAHAAVLVMRGIAPAQAASTTAAAPAAAPAAPAKPTLPPSLASMPAAAAQPIGADPLDDIMGIEDPDVREARWAALSPQQRTQALRATVPAARTR